jgi:ammonia channel protein AmtB
MLNIKVWTMALGCFLAASFTLCVVGGLIAPGLPIKHVTLQAVLPGFVWISPGAFVLGLVESFLFGVYAGLVFVPLHNLFARRWGRP